MGSGSISPKGMPSTVVVHAFEAAVKGTKER
jgi:hypothetical protein